MTEKIFLSYAYQDRAIAGQVKNHLREHGVVTTSDVKIFDPQKDTRVGDNIREIIKSQITEASKVVIIESPNAAQSQWVNYEAGMASALGKPIIVIRSHRAEFDPSKMMSQFTKAFADYQIPGLDMSKLVEHQRKNIEALTAANQRALEGLQTVANRQSEILRETMDEAVAALKEISASEGPTQAASKQAELLGKALERALGNMRELAEMEAKSNTEAFEEVIKQLARKMTTQAKGQGTTP